MAKQKNVKVVNEFLTKRRIKAAEPEKDSSKTKKAAKAQKVVFVEIDDEVTTVCDRIKKIRAKSIYLVVPKRALIFQSLVNLKILKRKAADLDRNLVLITQDTNGAKIANRIGLKVQDKMESKTEPSLVNAQLKEEFVTPLKAAVNNISDNQPSRIKAKKLSISELIALSRQKSGFSRASLAASRKSKSKTEKSGGGSSSGEKFSPINFKPSNGLLAGLIGLGLVVLLVVAWVALPGATVYLKPKSSPLSVPANIVLADYASNKAELDTRPARTIALYPVSTNFEKVKVYQATGVKSDGTAASGKIAINNYSGNAWTLIPKTRFMTSDGLVYRINRQVVVPAGSQSKPGRLEVAVFADDLDNKGVLVGEKGNIKQGTKMRLPGLSPENQERINAESIEDFTGGVTSSKRLASAKDIEAAEKIMNDELKETAVSELKREIEARNQKQNTDLILLNSKDRNDIIGLSGIKVEIPAGIEGKELESFEVRGSASASGMAYSKSELIGILKKELVLRKNPEKRLVKIDEESINFDNLKIVEFDKATKRIKITPTILGTEEFEVDPEKENGQRLIKKIKEHIAGKDVKDARDFIQNLPEIERVKIDTWPMWSPTVPALVDNIKIELLNE